ncbi:hypothetical protein [uncultured Maribacter sp.]|uniref:hypothetical protein n=1 Tax=uncultured Maribacter sp. TaxID=431308 RepID=UPI002629DF90|nr:hypothetical protein [uncultured Maribacter sp.]
MTGTLIALISILVGIIAANSFGYTVKKYSFGIMGNTIAGVFGSVFLIKSFGRLGFDPWSIMNNEDFVGLRLVINIVVSALGGVVGLILAKLLYNKIN